MFWYCAFCGRYHTGLTKRYDFSGWRKKGKPDGRDNLCGKGILSVSLLKGSMEVKGMNEEQKRLEKSLLEYIERETTQRLEGERMDIPAVAHELIELWKITG